MTRPMTSTPSRDSRAEPRTAEDAITAALEHAGGYLGYRHSRVEAFLGVLREQGFDVTEAAALPGRAALPASSEGLDVEPGPLTARWYHVGRPWSNSAGLIYAGSEDPHVGTFIADCGSWSDETFFGERPKLAAGEIADLIVRDHNAALRTLAARLATPATEPQP